ISHFDSVRLEWLVPDWLMSRLPSERSARREAPSMWTGKGRIELGCCMFVVAVQRVWRDDEQSQVVVACLDQAFLAHEPSVSMVLGKPRANHGGIVSRIGDPGKVRNRSLNRIGKRSFSALGQVSNGLIESTLGPTNVGQRSVELGRFAIA